MATAGDGPSAAAPHSNGSLFEESDDEGGVAWRSKEPVPLYNFAVLGDLHLEDNQMDVFNAARSQIVSQLTTRRGRPAPGARIFQLGDVGGYTSNPGSRACFERALHFLDGFGLPRTSVTGNHDLEGTEFATDAENLTVWSEMFGQPHFWALELPGDTLCIGLSTVQFRDAPGSCHEVYVDEEQVEWFRATLAASREKHVFVFTHAPPMGSGLTSLQEIHVRNRCSWLNHSSNPQIFLEIVRQNPQIKLWFSGHFHLSHDYEGSVTRRGNCLFVQTGVMGDCHRDGRRHSRVVKGDGEGYQLYTLDHGSGTLRLDAIHSYASEPQLPPQRLWCSNLFYLTSCPGGGVFSPVMQQDLHPEKDQAPPGLATRARWFRAGDTILALHANQLVEYDQATHAPTGVVCDAVNGRDVRFDVGGAEGGAVAAVELVPSDESKAYEQRILNGLDMHGSLAFERIERNAQGGFWRVYQANKWHGRRRAFLERAAAAQVAATATAAAAAS